MPSMHLSNDNCDKFLINYISCIHLYIILNRYIKLQCEVNQNLISNGFLLICNCIQRLRNTWKYYRLLSLHRVKSVKSKKCLLKAKLKCGTAANLKILQIDDSSVSLERRLLCTSHLRHLFSCGRKTFH